MERPCPLRRAGCAARVALGQPIAALRPRRAYARNRGPKPTIQRRLGCLGSSSDGSYDTGLTRSQEGRRQRARRKASSASDDALVSWSPSEPAPSRSDWLQGAKQQRTEVLLEALLSPEDIPLQRLPVLLTLLEGRPDLENCLVTAGLPAVAAAVLRSDMLQRLLPGGTLHELLLGLVEYQAPDLTAGELLAAAQLLAAWQPPTSSEALALAAAAVAAALTDRAHGPADGGGGGLSAAEADTDADAALLAEALALLHPWLSWSAAGGAAAVWGPGGSGSEAEEAEEAMEGARAAVRALLRRASATASASGSSVDALYGIVSAAARYDLEVPVDLARAAATLAAVASTSSAASAGAQTGAAADLAAQLVAQACLGSGAGGGGGIPLTAAEVRALVTSRLVPYLDSAQHTAFLRALLSRMQEQQGGAAAAEGRLEAARQPHSGLLDALGASAPGLGAAALALSMDCLATTGQGSDAAGVAQQLLDSAAMLAARRRRQDCTADELCRLAAAAVRLQRSGSSAATSDGAAAAIAASVASLLAAVQGASLQDASADAVAALIAATVALAAAAPFVPGAADGFPEGLDIMPSSSPSPSPGVAKASGAPGMPPALLDVLLQRLAEAEAEAKAARASASADDAPGARHRRPATSATPQLTYEQATAVLAAVTAAAEDAAAAAPSTSSSTTAAAPAALPSDRAALFRAAGLVACRALAPCVRRLDAASATSLLHLIARADRAGVRPGYPPLLWALHERLRVLAASMGPPTALEVLRGCVALRWRPAVLLRDLLLPLLRGLQARSGVAGAPVAYQDNSALRSFPAPAAGAAGTSGQGGQRDEGPRAWAAGELRESLVLLACLGYRGPLASSMVKLGVGGLLRAAEAGGAAAQLSAADLATLLWVCVAMRYRGAAVLRPLLQQLLQVPASQVQVRVAAQAVWAAARLGVVGERLVRWALSCCQGAGKLTAAPPQSLANLCWGLAKMGVKPPRAFITMAAAACVSQLRNLKAQELATTLFALATWKGRMGSGADAAAVVQHVVATRASFDGPALCTAAWALQRLSAPPPPPVAADASGGGGSLTASGGPPTTPPGDSVAADADAGVAAALGADALAAFEERLLDALAAADPRVGIPDHHLLRYFSTCASAGHRPARLLGSYATSLLPRLDCLRACPPDAPGAERRSRMLWSAARVLATFGLRDRDLLVSLELASERCQALLSPGHLAGLLNGMAALGHYPAHWAARGLLRRVGLALRGADLTEAGLMLEALAAWRQHLTATPPPSSRAAEGRGRQADELDEREGTSERQAEGQEAEQASERVAGNGLAAAASAAREGPRLRAPDVQRVDLLRRTALARLTQLCAPPPPPPPSPPAVEPLAPPAAIPGVAAAAPSAPASPATASLPSLTPPRSPPSVPPAAASPAIAPAAAAAAVEISLDDAMRLLTALARLRWQCSVVEAVLVGVAARLPVERRRRVPELTTLLWALASLRHDTPEVLDDLQAALLGLPHQRSLAAELTLLESGRAGLMLGAHPSSAPPPPLTEAAPVAVAPPAYTAPAPTPATPALGSEPTHSAANAQAVADAHSMHSVAEATTPGEAQAASEDVAAADNEQRSSPPVHASSPAGSPTAAAAASSGSAPSSGGLLLRPLKPAHPVDPAADAAAAATTADAAAAAAAAFDPAAATAAAAAAVNQLHEQQLGGLMSVGQLASEPWSPADVFKALWSCAKMNRHPGPQVLAAAERSWLRYTAPAGGGAPAATSPAEAAAAPPPPPMHAVTGLLWALSVFRHHNGSFAQHLSAQLAARLQGGLVDEAGTAGDDGNGNGGGGGGAWREAEEQAFSRQALQVAACLLAAQADRAESPLNSALAPETRSRLVAAWRSRLAERVAHAPNRYQADLVSVLRKMGFTVAANVATPDGCAVVDVAVALAAAPPPASASAPGAADATATSQPPRLLALELVGRHNSAANSPRIMGEAVLKYRLLQARGYLVVPIPCYEWDRIGHQDVWTKMVYLQAKIDRRTGGASGVSAAAPPAMQAAGAPRLGGSSATGGGSAAFG